MKSKSTFLYSSQESEVVNAMSEKNDIRMNTMTRRKPLMAILLFALLVGLIGFSTPVEAAVSRIGAWTEPINNDVLTPWASAAAVTIGTGNSYRALVAVVGLDYTTLPTSAVTATATLGGQTMSQAAWVCSNAAGSYGRCSGIFYLNELQIQAQVGGILTIVPSSTAGTPNVVAYIGTFANVDQDNPIADFSTNQSGATLVTTLVFGKSVAIGAGDMGIYHLDNNNTASVVSNYGSANWTLGMSDTTTGHSSFVVQRAVPTTATAENIGPTFTSNISSIAVVVLNDGLKTLVAEGTPAAVGSTVGTSSVATNLGAFRLAVDKGAGTDDDTITGMTVTLSANSAQVQTVTVWDNPPTTQLATIPFVSGETWTATGLSLAAADPPSSQYMLRLTSKAAVVSGTYPVSGSVTAVTTTKGFDKIFSDAGEAVVTIDSRTPTYPGVMTKSASTATSISVVFPYGGDNNNNNSCVIRVGTVSGTYPTTLTPTRVGKTWTATASALNPGSVYFFQGTFADPDTVSPATAVTGFIYTTENALNHNSANLGAIKWAANGGWGVGNGKYGRISCATCHISNPANGNIKRIKTAITTPDSSNWGSSASITTPAAGSIVATTPLTSYGANNTTHTTSIEVCEVCHSTTTVHKYNQTATAHYSDDCAACHKHGKAFAPPTDCALCHEQSTTAAPTAPKIFDKTGAVYRGAAYGNHLKGLKSETLSASTDWEAQCSMCHPMHTGGVTIANNPTMGINYAKTGGIHLGGTATTKSTQAEICWECHDKAANAVSEWKANTRTATGNSPYNYGELSSSNWTTATWSSSRAQFAYKSGAIQSTHTANSAVTDAALTGTAYGYTETKNTVDQILCSNCHDVHELALTTGDTAAGKPYLRGSWRGNPYEEDGAPRSLYANTTYFPDVGGWGAVPRADVTQRKLGGYWIDQNNVVPMTATTTGNGTAALNPTLTWTVDQFGGLCALCHGGGNASWTLTEVDGIDKKPAEGLWIGTNGNGHANAVKGGTGASSANSANVFTARLGDTTIANNNPRQHYFGQVDPADSVSTTGFRSTDGLSYAPILTSGSPRMYNTDSWVVDETGATKESQYHKFSCSKCHNPHASRLPKLLITNCLDTVHNTWDNQFPLNASTGTANVNREVAQWTSAQNCHRYSESNNATTTVPEYRASRTASPAGAGAGWNKVTPWKQTANVP